MSRYLPPLAFAVALAALGWLYLGEPAPPPPVDCTCRDLADHPTTYAGRTVRVSTLGTQLDRPGVLVWRRESHLAPAVVLRGPFPDAPLHLTGHCHAPTKPGSPVTVTGCRP